MPRFLLASPRYTLYIASRYLNNHLGGSTQSAQSGSAHPYATSRSSISPARARSFSRDSHVRLSLSLAMMPRVSEELRPVTRPDRIAGRWPASDHRVRNIRTRSRIRTTRARDFMALAVVELRPPISANADSFSRNRK